MEPENNNWQDKYYFTFQEWYQKLNGVSVKIDHIGKEVFVLDQNGQCVAHAKFSKSIDQSFDEKNLFNHTNDTRVGDFFYIMENGFGNSNWLFKREFVEI